MVTTGDEQASRNRALQEELYGESLGELFRRISERLDLTQARLASVIGISAPMLSQLMSGRRAKIGHPAVVQRVQALHELVEEVAAGRAGADDVRTRLDAIQVATSGPFTPPGRGEDRSGQLGQLGQPGGTTQTGQSVYAAGPASLAGLEPRVAVHVVQALLRAVSGADELLDAVRTLEGRHPELAEFLRVYGAGRTSEALDHYERLAAEL